MSYHTGKQPYTEVAQRAIYILHTHDNPYYYIGHCRYDLLRSVYNAHWRGQHHKTREFVFELKVKGLRPCLHILEAVTTTKVIAYRHVIAWTRIFDDAGFETLDEGRLLDYMGDLFGQALTVFEANKHIDLPAMFKCDTCAVKNFMRIRCPLYSPSTNN